MRRIAYLLLVAFMFVSPPVFADQDNTWNIPSNEYENNSGSNNRIGSENIYYDRDFYIPYMPGAKDCYGAYRLISHAGTYNVSKITGTLDYTLNEPVTQKSSKQVNDIFQTVDMIRSDVVVFTNFGVVETKKRIEYFAGIPRVYYDTYYYETPFLVLGYYLDTSPTFGSSAVYDVGRPYFIAMDIENMTKIFDGVTEKEIQKSLINFQGTNPKGQIIPKGIGKQDGKLYGVASGPDRLIRKNPRKYVVSQMPDRVVLNWWEELSQEFVKSLEPDDVMWMEVDDFYDEMSFRDGKFPSSVPVYRTSFDTFLDFDKMRKLWTSVAEAKKNTPNPFPKHFTDAMQAGSAGTWRNDTGTLISHDPNLLARWVFQVNKEPLRENLQVKVSNTVPTDFSVLKNVDDKLYRFVAPAGDPNLLFAFAPFDDSPFYYKSGAYVFFPYKEKYRSSEPENLDIRDTLEDLQGEERTIITEALKNWKLGHGTFKGNSDTYIYEVAGCYFVPADRTKLLSSLRSGPFSDVIKKFNIPAFGYPFSVSGIKAILKEW